jgi:hypothetical protein
MSIVDPAVLSLLALIAAVVIWTYLQIQSLHRRLTSLEKQHLALVQELEERLYPHGRT